MERNEIRIGRISSVNRTNGTCRVVYKDKDDAVTMELPLFSMNGEYKMPDIDSLVLVTHLSNGSAAGVVMGEFWWDRKRPPDPSAEWRKDISTEAGEAYEEYKNSIYRMLAPRIVLQTDLNTVDIDALISRIENLGVVLAGTKADWEAAGDTPSEAGRLYVVTDYKQDVDEQGNPVDVPGVKVGDGVTPVCELSYVDASDDVLQDHINNTTVHITAMERERWNGKVSIALDQEDDGHLIFMIS